MAAAVTYQFYKDVYEGGLSGSAFGLALPAASRHVRWLVGGFSLGDFKVTHYEDEGTTGEEIATADALKELVGTSLAFSGVR